jgi:hypothetical protein
MRPAVAKRRADPLHAAQQALFSAKEGTMHTAPGIGSPACIPSKTAKQASGFQLRFNSLFTGRSLSFPCDACGVVDLDALSEQARDNLIRARNGIGRDYSLPQVLPAY